MYSYISRKIAAAFVREPPLILNSKSFEIYYFFPLFSSSLKTIGQSVSDKRNAEKFLEISQRLR